jgi:hypothetical protein
MKGKLSNLCVFMILLCLFIGCSKTGKKDIIEIQQNGEDNKIDIIIEYPINDINLENNNVVEKVNINDFYFNEIMKDINLYHHIGEYKIIELFGEPLEIVNGNYSEDIGDGMILKSYNYVYDDFTHYYYVIENELILYGGFFIDKKLERLTTINIGDTAEKIILTFTDDYGGYSDESIKYIIENKIRQGKKINFISYDLRESQTDVYFFSTDDNILETINFIFVESLPDFLGWWLSSR